MNHTISDRFSRRAPQCGFLLVIVYLLITSVTSAVQFQPNDEVRLTRDAPLLFLDKPLRQGTTGETFKVLAYQPEKKKVFLAVKDPAGKEIAVSVAEDYVSLVPADKTKVQADVLAAVSRQQYAVAKSLLGQALRASPNDVDLHSASIALEALVKNAAQLNQAAINQKSVEADLKRQRRNADVTDHANPLDASDHSGQQRAAQMRKDANQIETQSAQEVRTAQTNYDATLSALKSMIQQTAKSTATKSSARATQISEASQPSTAPLFTTSPQNDALTTEREHIANSEDTSTSSGAYHDLTYSELRMNDALEVYPKIGESETSMTRYMFFYEQKRLREPLIKAAVISGSPWVASFCRLSATMISGVLCAEAGFRGVRGEGGWL